MIQQLKIGNNVDDGTGDYLRDGGQKINENFNELYSELGDGVVPFPAGAWETLSSPTIKAAFGKAYILNTSVNEILVNLPKGTTKDYGKTIKFRDSYGTWQTNGATIAAAVGDTLKGDSGSKKFTTNLTDLEMVYCAPGRWEFVSNKQLNKISAGDLATVTRKEFIATDGQTDFLKVFGDNSYNSSNIQIYRRGNLLYYGDVFSDNSDFGSPDGASGIKPLDGNNIRLREPCEENDAVIIITYLDGVATWRSTYNRLDAVVLDENKTTDVSLDGSIIVADLTTLKSITPKQLGYNLTTDSGLINPNTFEVYRNGVILNQVGTAGQPTFRCDGVDGVTNVDDCVAMGGSWVASNTDYSLSIGDNGSIESVEFDTLFEHGDVITFKWFNNVIGTLMEIDDILDVTDDRYVVSGTPINITGGIRVTDYQNPTIKNTEPVGPQSIDLGNATAIFDLIYPIGTPYENALNPNNPATYMGFGTWVLWGEKQVSVGWTKDTQDTLFGLNNNDIDVNGNPSHTAGGTGGVRSNILENDNLPTSKTDEKVLIADPNGNIIIGACQFDPDSQGPAYDKYREDFATINVSQPIPKEISNIQPYITVYRWLRVA